LGKSGVVVTQTLPLQQQTSAPSQVKLQPQEEPGLQPLLIPKSALGDKGQYYLLEARREGSLVKTLHKRVGVDSVGFTRVEINCQSMQFRQLGYGEGSIASIQSNTSDWSDLVAGSSKSDLVNFVCMKF
jgi:hypothetical protein